MEEKNDLFGKKHATLWHISMWASGLAPIVFFIYVIFGLWKIFQYNEIAHTQYNTDLLGLFSQNPIYILDVTLQTCREFLIGAIIYLALKGVSLAFDMIVETDVNYREKSAEDNKNEEWGNKLPVNVNQPDFYDIQDVVKHRNNVNRATIAVSSLYAFLGLLNFEFVRAFIQGAPLVVSEIRLSAANIISTVIVIGINISIVYFPLKTLTYILKILMEMEFNSRKTN